MVYDRDWCLEQDAADPLARLREHFALPDGLIYLDGNSLGPLSHTARARIDHVMREEWGKGLIGSWNTAGWMDLPAAVAAKLAPLLGVEADEISVADSTSLNLFKLLAAGLALRPGRRVILTDAENFPTDLYVAQGLGDWLGDAIEVRRLPVDRLTEGLDDQVALISLTQVDFRGGRIHDMPGLTAKAHGAGALALWDLSHSTGAIPLDLAAASVDLAVGCGYKYLNGGPGAPAYAFVARRHHDALRSPISGWMGHASPFDFSPNYAPAAGIARLNAGTPAILALSAFDAAMSLWAEVDIAALRAKSLALSELFIARAESRLAGHGFALASPREGERRGSQVSFRHPDGYAVMQALIAAGVVGDFRAPDLLRFGFAPLYLRFVDAFDAIERWAGIMQRETWRDPAFARRRAVT